MSPLDRFGPATRRWFHDTFSAPTRVQQLGWGPIQDHKHALLLAPTGSGKTLAAFLACLDQVSQLPIDAPEGVRVLYISPLKALVYDIERNLRAPLVGLANAAAREGYTVRPIRVDIRTGDTPQKARRAQSKHPGDILVTTPESLFLLLGSQARETLRTVQTIIVDEIHVMAGTKRGVHLALSLERLSALCEDDPQRIGLSATQRPLEAIASFLGGPRAVEVVDTSEPPNIDLQIVVPVADMDRPVAAVPALAGGDGERQLHGGRSAGPAAQPPNKLQQGMWPTIYPRILELIRSHRSTIVFTNSRLLCERLAQRLNELAGEDLVRAHHGSISHAQRAVTEEMLKSGQLPAIIATSSLELGIDMGAVDLVVLVESPGAVSRGLQRIGRAGHGVGQTSEGRIFPKYKGDLVECAVVADHMTKGLIEETRVPRNCLDVLAQQIIAMTAEQSWTVGELGALIRKASPYRELSETAFTGVLDMLSGRYPSDAFADLSPRINWDRTTDTVKGRRGAKVLSNLNAGTIPDRGLYGVFLAGSGAEAGSKSTRLGELDEEMVYESRKGDTIILGATTWRIEDITRDQVIVSPAPGEPGRLPFWHGDRPGRPAELGRAVGGFLRKISALKPGAAHAELLKSTPLDALAVTNLISYVHEQRELTGVVPNDKTLVVERFRDELGDWRVCILCPFGTRVHAPWAMAMEALLSARAGFEVQTLWTDDGIALRFADIDELPELDMLFIDPDEVEDLVVEQLGNSALFAARFRENAARALLLPRKSYKGRTPLWQQRLRAQRLQAVATGFPGFPIVLETFRECLQEVFDLPALREVLSAIQQRRIAVHEVETRSASPFARSLVFAYVAAYMYDGDAPLAERKAQALTLDRSLLRDLLGQEELRELLDGAAVAEVEAELQWLTDDRRAAHADAVHDLLRRLGDLSFEELAARCEETPATWLQHLELSRRVLPVRIGGQERYIAIEDAARYRDALGTSLPMGLPHVFLETAERPLESLLARWARTHGPFVAGPVAERFGLQPAVVEAVLRALEAEGTLVQGAIRPGGQGLEWCDNEVMRRLRRRSLARLRKQIAPVESEVYGRFLPSWHGIGSKRSGTTRLREVIDQLEALPIPFSTLESDVLPARMQHYESRLLDELGTMGELVWVGRGALGTKDGRVALVRRERVPLLLDPPEAPDGFFEEDEIGPIRRAVLERLLERGACFLVELQQASGASLALLTQAVWDLVWGGLITNDTFQPLRGIRSRARRGSARRSRAQTAGGRWSAVAHLIGTPPDATQRAHARALLLLERYGIASGSAAQAESLPGGYSAVYPVLRAMEESGKARRGWFVDGLQGAQFALSGAVDRLRSCSKPTSDALVLSATDPASPWGSLLPWPAATGGAQGKARRDAGSRVVMVGGAPVLWVGKGGRSLISFPAEPDTVVAAVEVLKAHPTSRRSLRIDRIDGDAALKSPLKARFLDAGFVEDYKGLQLT